MLSGAAHGAKVHLGCDVDTLQIRARDHHVVGDSLVAAELLAQKLSHETVASFMGDGAYETQYVHEACHRRGAITIIPPSRVHGREKGQHSRRRIATRRSRRASSLPVLSENVGAATTEITRGDEDELLLRK